MIMTPDVTTAQRYGLIERLDRFKGRRRNVLLMMDADTTKAAVTAMRSASVRRKGRSGDIFSVVPAKAGTHNHRRSC